MTMKKYLNIAIALAILLNVVTLLFAPENIILDQIVLRLLIACCLVRIFVFSDKVSYLLEGKVYRTIFWILLAFYLVSSFVVPYNGQVNKFSIIILAVYLVVIVIVDIKNYDFNTK